MTGALPVASRAYDDATEGKRTSAWFWFRALIAVSIGIGLVLVVSPAPMFDDRISVHLAPFDIPAGIAITVGAFLVATVGLLWISRILRGAGEGEPPPWRYPDH